MLFRKTPRRHEYTTVPTEYGHVMLDESRGQYWHLNDSALTVTRCLRDGGSRDDAADALVASYGIERGVARRDVDAACETLQKVGLL